MASKIAEKAPGWVARILLPEISEMKGDLKALNVKVDAGNAKTDAVRVELLGKIDAARGELLGKIESLRNEVMSLRNELKSDISSVVFKIEELEKRLDVVQRLAVIEAKLREVEKKNL